MEGGDWNLEIIDELPELVRDFRLLGLGLPILTVDALFSSVSSRAGVYLNYAKATSGVRPISLLIRVKILRTISLRS